MRLTKKHIGQLFDVRGADGSWAYLLIDVRETELLFYRPDPKHPYEIQLASHTDWRPYKPPKPWPKDWTEYGWNTGRRSPL